MWTIDDMECMLDLICDIDTGSNEFVFIAFIATLPLKDGQDEQ